MRVLESALLCCSFSEEKFRDAISAQLCRHCFRVGIVLSREQVRVFRPMHAPKVQAREMLGLHAATAYGLGHLHHTAGTASPSKKKAEIDLSTYLLKALHHDASGVMKTPQGMSAARHAAEVSGRAQYVTARRRTARKQVFMRYSSVFTAGRNTWNTFQSSGKGA